MPAATRYHKHLLLLPHDLYWRVFREVRRQEQKQCKRSSINEYVRQALELALARPEKEGE